VPINFRVEDQRLIVTRRGRRTDIEWSELRRCVPRPGYLFLRFIRPSYLYIPTDGVDPAALEYIKNRIILYGRDHTD